MKKSSTTVIWWRIHEREWRICGSIGESYFLPFEKVTELFASKKITSVSREWRRVIYVLD